MPKLFLQSGFLGEILTSSVTGSQYALPHSTYGGSGRVTTTVPSQGSRAAPGVCPLRPWSVTWRWGHHSAPLFGTVPVFVRRGDVWSN